jgi:hypothetical protein
MASYTATTNPMIIPAPALTATTSIVMNHPVFAKRIEWYAPITIGDTISVQDFNGNVIVQGKCEVASQSQILWTGPQKLTLPNKVGSTSSWQVVNAYNAASTSTLLVWY